MLDKLQEAFTDDKGKVDLDLMLFYVTWLKNGMVASYAYKELHPDVTDGSAEVLGSRLLSKVKHDLVMAAHGLDANVYFTQLKDGLGAEKSDITGTRYPDHKTRRPYHEALGKILSVEKEGGANIQINNFIPLLGSDSVKGESVDV